MLANCEIGRHRLRGSSVVHLGKMSKSFYLTNGANMTLKSFAGLCKQAHTQCTNAMLTQFLTARLKNRHVTAIAAGMFDKDSYIQQRVLMLS